MSNIDKRALREAAEKALNARERLALMESVFEDDGDDVKPEAQEDISICISFNDLTNPATVLALLDELEAVQKTSAARLGAIDTTHKMFQRERDRAEKAEKRIAELQIARDKCFLSGLKTGWEYGIADETEGYNREIADAQAVVDRAAAAGKGE